MCIYIYTHKYMHRFLPKRYAAQSELHVRSSAPKFGCLFHCFMLEAEKFLSSTTVKKR